MELVQIQRNVDDFQRAIKESSSISKKYDILKESYAYLKDEASFLANAGALDKIVPISRQVHFMAESLPCESLISTKPYDFSKINLKPYMSIEEILDFIVYQERCRLLDIAKSKGCTCLEDFDLFNECQKSALSVYGMAKAFNLDVAIKIIEPGYIYESPIFDGGCKHCVVIVIYMGKMYLIDTTYSQFFMTKRCVIEKMGVPYLVTANPGTFMVMDESRRKTAEKVLNDGWIELREENLKNYFDGFTLFYRNGLYYEQTDDFSYLTEYTSEDYLKFISGFDNQVRHEVYETLGYQTRALTNPKMSFNRR